MDIEILSIGNELLTGSVINSNAAFISSELLKHGYRVDRHTTIPDKDEILKQEMTIALSRSQVVITTGGLGPTCDDKTKYIASHLCGSELVYNETIAQNLIKRYGEKMISLKEQSTLPLNADFLINRVGTATGLVLKYNSSFLILMPGVPSEMKIMCTEQLIPYLKKQIPSKNVYFSKELYYLNVIESQIDPILRDIENKFPHIEIGIYPLPSLVLVSLSVLTSQQTHMNEVIEAMNLINQSFGHALVNLEKGDLSLSVKNFFVGKNITLSTAESCTGGAVATYLVKTPGASDYFLGSLVSYSNELKEKLLNVSKEIIQSKGAVSAETVSEMLRGVLDKTKSDYGIAISGVAGPDGGTDNSPVGTVWYAIGKVNCEPLVSKIVLRGDREAIINKTVNVVLGYLLKYAQALEG